VCLALRDIAREKVQQLIRNYDSVVEAGKRGEYSEADVGSKFILPLLSALGWDTTRIEDVKEQRRTLTGVADYSLLNVGGTSKIFLELKKFEEDLDGSRRVGGKVKSFPQMAIDYAWQSRADWAILTNFEEIRLYYSRVKKPEDGLIFRLRYNDYLVSFDKLWLLSKESVVSGLLDTYEKRRLRREVDEELLKDLVYCRKLLVSNVRKNNPQLSKDEINESTQKILDRLMFIRSCEDRLIIPVESLWTQFSVWQKISIDKSVRTFMMDLKNIFRDFDAVYNGKLFAPHICEDLRVDNEVLESVLMLLYNYNFDLIPVDVLGNAYELYIGTIIKEKEGILTEDELILVEDASVRKKHGIYYTPEYVVDYIVRNTLGELLKNCKMPDEVSKIKVLDPACGSGSFLIKAFDVIKEWYDNYNRRNQLAANRNTLEAHFHTVPNVEERILTDNLYGVDLDPQAVEITILNLSLKAVRTKRKLPYMGDHIVCGNSLVSGTTEELKEYFDDPHEKRPFDWHSAFPEVFKQGGFDVIIGNPPYVESRDIPNDDWEYFRKNFSSAYKRFDLSVLFMEQAIKLLKPRRLLGFITSNKFAVSDYGQGIRSFILNNCSIKQLVDVSNIDVFRDASTYPYISIFLREADESKRINNLIICVQESTKEDFVSKNLKSKIVRQNIFWVIPNFVFSLSLSDEVYSIIEKIQSNCIKLSDLTWIRDGIHTGNVKEKLVVSRQLTSECKPMVTAESINRYNIQWKGLWVNYNQNLIDSASGEYGSLREQWIFEAKEKLLTALFGLRPEVAYDNKQFYANNSVKLILLKRSDFSLKYILAILNSSLIWFYYKTLFGQTHVRGDYIQFYPADFKKLPIYAIDFSNKDQKKKHRELVELVDSLLSLNEQLNQLNVDFDRYLTEPIIAYANFKDYYNKLDVKDKEALDKTSKGTIKQIKAEEQDTWLVFKANYFAKTNKTKEEFTNVPVLRCRFEDLYFRKFLLHVFQNYKKRWGTGNLLSIILNTPIPCFDKNPEKNNQTIEKIMKQYLKALEEKEQLEKEIQQTDKTIDTKVYELYGLTPEEITIVENSLKQK